jgi:large subunit ribosomal protein L13
MKMTKSYLPKANEIKRKWHVIDGADVVLGRLSTKAADLLRGKQKAIYTPNVDCGDFVLVLNAAKIRLTGDKLEQKTDYRHSGYSGGGVLTQYKKLMAEQPEKAVLKAVMGMLPDNRLAARQLTRLKVFRGSEHTHAAQIAGESK